MGSRLVVWRLIWDQELKRVRLSSSQAVSIRRKNRQGRRAVNRRQSEDVKTPM